MPSAVAFVGQGWGCGFEGKMQGLGPSYWQLGVGAALVLAAGPTRVFPGARREGQEEKGKQGWEPESSSPSQAGSGELAWHVRGWKPEARDDDQRLEVLSF